MNPNSDKFLTHRRRRRGFTLIELLTVVAVIGILSAITMPVARSVYIKAKKAKTRAQFSQWGAAMELYNSEYGNFPPVDGNYSGGGSANVNMINSEKFSVALTGRKLDGTDADLRVSSASAEKKVGNTKLIAFYTIAETELTAAESNSRKLRDYFGNTEIAVIYDKNGDGIINGSDVRVIPAVSTLDQASKFEPDTNTDINLTKGLHMPVVFYSAGNGDTSGGKIDAEDAVLSWK